MVSEAQGMTERIRIITDQRELEGTCYIEVLPGPYKNQCWNDGSLYFEEEVFGYVEPIFERHVAAYDHYAFTPIEKVACMSIAEALERLAELTATAASISELAPHIGFVFNGSKQRFESAFESNKIALAKLARQFAIWIRSTTTEHECITVLGI